MQTATIHTIQLNNGVQMPTLGLGVYQLQGDEAVRAILWALEAGYRHIDTAALYMNEKEVGRSIKQSGIPRSEIFVTTKIYPTSFLFAEEAFERSLDNLQMDYVDLYLIHWPEAGKSNAWKILERIYAQKQARAIGVSNYAIEDLEYLLENTDIVPTVNQVEFHPFFYQPLLLKYCKEKNIALEAYSPLNRGNKLNHPALERIACKYDRTPAQIMLRWSVQHGTILIPKSAKKDRIIENSKIFDFELENEDMDRLNSLI